MIDGTANTINVDTVSVALVSYGVTTTQGNGAGDTTTINLVTTPTPPNPTALGGGPPSIDVKQGDGSVGLVIHKHPVAAVNDSASVTNSTLPGDISITQTDSAKNSPMYNMAYISDDKVGYTVTIGGTIIHAFAGDLTINQGSADGDQAIVRSLDCRGRRHHHPGRW